MLRR
ncbi:hypothetical protein N499_1239A, partial [Wolbachia pipientis wVitA]|jgi:tungstate transport system permease protein